MALVTEAKYIGDKSTLNKGIEETPSETPIYLHRNL